MRLGDLDALKKSIEEQRKPKVYSEADERQNVIIDCILYIIDNAPTIIWCDKTPDGLPLMDIRPQGEWIVDEDSVFLYFKKCSNCDVGAECLDGGSQFLSNFCPNCGADMRGDGECPK